MSNNNNTDIIRKKLWKTAKFLPKLENNLFKSINIEIDGAHVTQKF